MLLILSSRAAPCSLSWLFSVQVSCFCRVMACAVLSLTSFCLRVDARRPRQVSLSPLSWHSMMSLVTSARQVRLHRPWRVDIAGTGESLTCTPCSSLTSARCRTTTLSAHGVWGWRESRTLTPCSPCKYMYGHMLTSSRFMDVSAARDSVLHWTCTLLSYTSILNDCASNPMAHLVWLSSRQRDNDVQHATVVFDMAC